jgi:plasmid stabilization system protein ParE
MKKTYTVSFSEDALLDILDAFHWYESVRDGLGKDFELCLDAEVNALKRSPRKQQVKYKGIRITFIERFPYGIHYLIEDAEVKIIAVFHTSRDPVNWTERLR